MSFLKKPFLIISSVINFTECCRIFFLVTVCCSGAVAKTGVPVLLLSGQSNNGLEGRAVLSDIVNINGVIGSYSF